MTLSKQLLTKNLNKHSSPSLLTTFRQIATLRFYTTAGLLATCYYLLQIYLLNVRLINGTVLGEHALSYKFVLLWELISGYWYAFSPLHSFFTLLCGILIGGNIAVLLAVYRGMKKRGSIRLSLGTSGLAALVTTGCPGCSLSLFSLMAPTASFSTLLMYNDWLKLAVVGLLMASFISSLKTIQKSQYCRIPSKP